MALRSHLNDREYDKFKDVSGETAVRVSVVEDSSAVDENIRQQILKDADLNRTFTWLDFGSKNQRISTIAYSTPNVVGTSLLRTFTYTLVGSNYRLDTDIWDVLP